MNRIIIDPPLVLANRIDYSYHIEGIWREAFQLDEAFFIEYSCDITGVPESIAIIPLLCNILPIAWIYDAEIVVPCVDKAFYESIPEFKHGYQQMYPQMQFGGKLIAVQIEENNPANSGKAATFFSGGVDAFNTLLQHIDEKPTLLTLWGADVTFEDIIGWQNVEKHLHETVETFGVESIVVKSAFRRFLNERALHPLVYKLSGDGWWHGFQHGIGIISHAAPVAYLYGFSTIYFASSFTEKEKGKVTCASDPTIDNFLRFGNSHIVHDGYEFCRQDKVHNIVSYAKETGICAQVRVCWTSIGGTNCCNCEKCWRTILEITAEGEDAHNFGFDFTKKQAKNARKLYWDKRNLPDYRRDSVYRSAQEEMHRNYTRNTIPDEFRWFYNIDIVKLGKRPMYRKVLSLGKRTVKKILRLVGMMR